MTMIGLSRQSSDHYNHSHKIDKKDFRDREDQTNVKWIKTSYTGTYELLESFAQILVTFHFPSQKLVHKSAGGIHQNAAN